MSDLNEIATALAKAQAEMQNPSFDSANPHFKSKFASLAAVRNAVVPVLAKHGISLIQDVRTNDAGAVTCTTILTHSSGQQMSFGPLAIPPTKADAQGLGSAATYARRYSMMAVAAVVGDEDDDAESAVGRGRVAYDDPRGDARERVPPAKAQDFAKRMKACLNAGIDQASYELHIELTRDSDLYIASSELLDSKERRAWKDAVARVVDAVRARKDPDRQPARM